MKHKEYKIVYLEWEDACDSEGTWFHPDTLQKYCDEQAVWHRTVGFLVAENKKRIVIASAAEAPDSESEIRQVGHLFKIPKGWIRKRKVLKL